MPVTGITSNSPSRRVGSPRLADRHRAPGESTAALWPDDDDRDDARIELPVHAHDDIISRSSAASGGTLSSARTIRRRTPALRHRDDRIEPDHLSARSAHQVEVEARPSSLPERSGSTNRKRK